jgi:GDPmannose 4,6-dehydratase
MRDSGKSDLKLDWVPEITVREMCREMVSYDLKEAKRQASLKQYGYKLRLSLD